MVSDQGKFIYVDICRTGSHSVREALSKHFDYVPSPNGNKKRDRRFARHHTLGNLTSCFSYCSTLTDEQLRNYYKFGFVRNPWDRVVSVYLYESARRYKGVFEDFVQRFYVERRLEGNYIRHLPQTEWMKRTPIHHIDMDFIGRFETLQEDFNKVCTHLGISNISLPHMSKSNRTHYRDYYNETTKRLVSEFYASDIEAFKYEF
jgi:hypothetical protein